MDSIEKAFSKYEKYAFRLETFPIYRVQGEREAYEYYLETGKIMENQELIEFCSKIQEKINGNKRHIRTRVLPLISNNYIEFETKIGYIPQSKIGVEFNFILQEDFDFFYEKYKLKDFWLFDDSSLFIMNYSSNGIFEGIEKEERIDVIESAVRLKEETIRKSKTLSFLLDEYLILK